MHHHIVSLDYQIWQSQQHKRLTARTNQLQDTIKNLIAAYKNNDDARVAVIMDQLEVLVGKEKHK